LPVIVVCPKCTKRQTVDGAVPPEGLRYACTGCQAAFMVKLPRSSAAPAPPAPAPAPPPAARRAATIAPPPPADPGGLQLDLGPSANDEPSRPFALDLPAAREDMPLPDDFLASREEVPRPGDLPAPRDAIPLPDDFLAPREDVPRPGDLPAPRDAIPLPDDFLISREQVPRPGDLPAPRDSIPLPDDFLISREQVPRPGDLPAPRDSIPLPDDFLASREQVPRPGDLPAPRESIPMPGDFLASRDQVPRPGDLPVTRDEAVLPRNLPTSVGHTGGRGNLPAARGGAGGGDGGGVAFDPFSSDFASSASTPLAPLDLGEDDDAEPTTPTLTPEQALTDQRSFGLELEGGQAPAEDDGGSRAVRFTLPTAHADGGDDLAPLAPVTRQRSGRAARQEIPDDPSWRRKLVLGGAGALVVVGAVLVLLGVRKREASSDTLLGPLAGDIARDVYPAYQRAADRLLEVTTTRPDAVVERATAAEELLIAVLVHGADKAKLSQAEALVTALPADKPGPATTRARALLAIAKGKAVEAVGLLGDEASKPTGALVLALRDLASDKPAAAAGPLRRLCAAQPGRVLGHYLLGRALETTSPAEAGEAYRKALSLNRAHFGAALGLARLIEDPTERLVALHKLVDTKPSVASRSETADAYVAIGRAAQALGRGSEATAAYSKALLSESQNPSANIALGESYMLEGRYVDALQRFQASGATALKTAAGKFGLGGALVATGMTQQGMAQIRQAAQENPKDPRGLFYTGFAAEIARPPDLEAASQDYRAALKLDRTFLPATLRLAALIEKQGRPDEALAVLKQAEEAGAPAAALQIAWGEALIVARQPARAEAVFRKVVNDNPKDAPPRLGLAEALDAQGKTDDARLVLEEAVATMPQALAVRDRLASLEAKLGHKEEAIAQYRTEIASGNAPPSARVELAKLAIDVGRLDEAKQELDKVTEESPSTPEALFTLARMWEARKDLPRALQEYRRALRFDPTPALQLAFARALIRFGKESEAMAALDAAAIVPEGLLERGRLLFRRGEYDRAVADFEAASKMAPRDPQPLLWVGASCDKLGQSDRATEAWRAALRLAPDDPETHYRLGRAELDKGRVTTALEHLRRAAAHAPDAAEWSAELYFQLGTAESTGGHRSAAVVAFKKYIDLAPADAPARPEVEKQIRRLSGR
jgi:tetratricopeptide (TPR) repeat protein